MYGNPMKKIIGIMLYSAHMLDSIDGAFGGHRMLIRKLHMEDNSLILWTQTQRLIQELGGKGRQVIHPLSAGQQVLLKTSHVFSALTLLFLYG